MKATRLYVSSRGNGMVKAYPNTAKIYTPLIKKFVVLMYQSTVMLYIEHTKTYIFILWKRNGVDHHFKESTFYSNSNSIFL